MQNYWGVGNGENKERERRKSKPKNLPLRTEIPKHTKKSDWQQ
jgi:hypothetical protein